MCEYMHVHVCPFLSVCVCVCVKSEYSRVAFYEAANILLHVLSWAAPSLSEVIKVSALVSSLIACGLLR